MYTFLPLQTSMHITQPLTGLLVVSIEQAVAAPWCTARLCEAGVRVIKIERPDVGDFARGYDLAAKGESSYFVHLNQNKESVALNLKKSTDRNLLERMVAHADVFVQNLAPGAMQRLGFSHTRLRADYPRLITCDISGYGGAHNEMKAYDFLVQAESGLVGISGGTKNFGRIGVSICDMGAGMSAHAAILEALLLRYRTNQGSALEVSLFDVAAEWMTVPLLHSQNGTQVTRGLQHPSISPYDGFMTKDGIVIIGIQNELEWQRFCQIVLKQPEMADNHRFHSNNNRVANRTMLNEIINQVTQMHSSQELVALLQKGKIAYGQINDLNHVAQHVALKLRQVHTAEGTACAIPKRPFATHQCSEYTRTPWLGEHTDAVRAEFNG